MEKHITSLEELEIKNKRMDYLNLKEYGLFEIEAVKSFISSREEKAREEGRREANKESYWDIKKSEEAITQYKEDLLGKINKLYQDERPVDCIDGETPVETYGYEETHNNALSEVKKLL